MSALLTLLAVWAAIAVPIWLYVAHLHATGKRVRRTTRKTDHTQAREWGL